jgi:L-threonylcarbamoyladenylate synthase
MDNFPTPPGAVRLASPSNNVEFAKVLYRSLRLADSKMLNKVFVIPPIGDDISVAICDRLKKASLSS